MFFEADTINSILRCQNCQKKFDEPRVLPCGTTICTLCIENKSYTCQLCENTHLEPENGFPVNKLLSELLVQESKDVYRGKYVERFKRNLLALRSSKKRFAINVETGVDKIREHCMGLRINVDLAAEEAIEQINKFRYSILDEINKYEKEATNAYQTDEESQRNFTEFIDELGKFDEEWSNYLKQPQIDDDTVSATNNVALKLDAEYKANEIKLNAIVFNKQFVKFNRVFDHFSSNILGEITYRQLIKTSLRKSDEIIDLNSLLTKSRISNAHNFSIESSDNQLFNILFVDEEETKDVLHYMTINRHLSVVSTYEYDYAKVEYFKKYGDSILVSSFGPDNYHVDILNQNLVRTCYKNFSDVSQVKPTDLSMCEANVYYHVNDGPEPLRVLEKGEGVLTLIETKGQMKEPGGLLYLPADLRQLEIKDNKYFWLNGSSLNILNKEDNRLIKSVEINANKFVFDSEDKILAFDMNTREMKYFDYGLNLLEKLVVESLGNDLQSVFLFLNKANNQVYLFDKNSKILSFYFKSLEYNE